VASKICIYTDTQVEKLVLFFGVGVVLALPRPARRPARRSRRAIPRASRAARVAGRPDLDTEAMRPFAWGQRFAGAGCTDVRLYAACARAALPDLAAGRASLHVRAASAAGKRRRPWRRAPCLTLT
jgi:hypothetical protein